MNRHAEDRTDVRARIQVLGYGLLSVALLAMGALNGKHLATHGENWARVATGKTWYTCWGSAALLGALLLVLYVLLTQERIARFEWLLPVRGRWAGYVCRGILIALWIVAVLLAALPLLVVF